MKADLAAFAEELEQRIIRKVDYVTVIPLHGSLLHFADLQEAILAVENYVIGPATADFVRFEVRLAYTNGDLIQASFGSASDAVDFLRTFT